MSGKEYAAFILTDNLPPPSSSVDSSSRDACKRERRNRIIDMHVYRFSHGGEMTYRGLSPENLTQLIGTIR
jgi:hypothetical protein